MRARNHSGRRARGAGGVSETGVGMDAALVVTGVSGINSAMGKSLSTGRPNGAAETCECYVPARRSAELSLNSVPYSRRSAQIARVRIEQCFLFPRLSFLRSTRAKKTNI